MTLGPGARLGPYEVTALLGEGGMGKVWRAHHAALNETMRSMCRRMDSRRTRSAALESGGSAGPCVVESSEHRPRLRLEQLDGVQALVMELVTE